MSDSLDKQLKELRAPPPDPRARRAAVEAALAEFERARAANDERAGQTTSAGASKTSGFWRRLLRDDQSRGRTSMGWFVGRSVFGTVASVCMVAFGLAVFWPMFTGRALISTERKPSVEYTEPPRRVRGQGETPMAVPAQAASGVELPKAVNAPELRKPRAGGRLAQPLTVSPAPASAPAPREQEDVEEIAVSGVRHTLEKSVSSTTTVNVIESEDIGRFPDANAAASLQRVPGVALKREASGVSVSSEGRDRFEHFETNAVKQVSEEPVSTFSADVDTSSYSFVRKQLDAGYLPQKDAVRAEEMINYFDYAWPTPESRAQPFKPTIVVTDSPWNKGHKLVHIGIKGYALEPNRQPDANLVLLLDVSGSMDEPDKLPLAKESMRLLLRSLKPTDTVAIVVYAGAAGEVLPPTPVGDKEKILAALDSLEPGGSTAGAEGIELAYALAEKNFRKDGVNRVILATDGDFNVGISDTNELEGFVERQRQKGIFLSVLGFGTGNYRDELAQALAQNGNGVAAYIDTLAEARKVLVQEAGSQLFTIAKDVKLQVEFNPATVSEYRLIGYETRALQREDFNNDAVDAGDIGAGHTVTAIYEITPVGAPRLIDERRYARAERHTDASKSNEYGFLKIRYKLPNESVSRLIEEPIRIDGGRVPEAIARDVRFSTAVAGFAQLLRGNPFIGKLSYDDVIEEARPALGPDEYGYRKEFVELARKARNAKPMN